MKHTQNIKSGATNLARGTRLFAALMVAIVASVVASNASAAEYWRFGTIGSYNTSPGFCQYLDAWGQFNLSIAGPSVFAANRTNYRDRQIVRYAIYLIDANGQTILWSGMSQAFYAYDDAPAQLPRLAFVNVPRFSRLDLRIEWLNDSWQLMSASAFRVTSYLRQTGSMGITGPMDSCA
jgi:hypothetical protein